MIEWLEKLGKILFGEVYSYELVGISIEEKILASFKEDFPYMSPSEWLNH